MNKGLTEILKAIRISGPSEVVVFCSRPGMPYCSFRTVFGRSVRKAEITAFTFHDLRHSFAGRLVIAGADLPTMKELMGHKQIHMTLCYRYLSSDREQRVMDTQEPCAEKLPVIVPTPQTGSTAPHIQPVVFSSVPR